MIQNTKTYTFVKGWFVEVDALERAVIYKRAQCEQEMNQLRIKWSKADINFSLNKPLHY
jgi:hypothetical protein